MHYLDTSNVTDMNSMFLRSSGLLELDVSSFDTSNVINMGQMFTELGNLRKLDVSSFETHQVTDMSHMFRGLISVEELDVSNFITSQVTDMAGMFASMNSLIELDVSNFDTSNVTEMWWMFASIRNVKSLDLSNFDTSKVTRMHSMFADARSLTILDLSSFDTRQVRSMGGMFDRVPLEQLTLGSEFVFYLLGGSPGLLPLTSSATHHPNWQNVGEGTVDEPKGSFVFTSAQLMSNYDGATMADTWVWQPRTFSNLIIEAEGQGTVSPATSTSVERGEMIDISATAESGWRFSHWRIESGEGTIADTNQAITTFVMGEEDTKLVAVFEELNSLLSIRIPTSAVFNTTSESKHRDIVSPDYEIGNESPFAVFVNVVEPTELKNMDIIEELNVAADGEENVLISQGSAHQTEAFRLFELATEETNTFTFTGTAEELPEGSSHITPTFNLVLRFVPNLS
nr:BspA family leucine-rich repeat surface protein [Enterococcus sp. DIV1298c]